jgi:hypothetical protein
VAVVLPIQVNCFYRAAFAGDVRETILKWGVLMNIVELKNKKINELTKLAKAAQYRRRCRYAQAGADLFFASGPD